MFKLHQFYFYQRPNINIKHVISIFKNSTLCYQCNARSRDPKFLSHITKSTCDLYEYKGH